MSNTQSKLSRGVWLWADWEENDLDMSEWERESESEKERKENLPDGDFRLAIG